MPLLTRAETTCQRKQQTKVITMNKITEYEQLALDFLAATDTTMTVKLVGPERKDWSENLHDHYVFTFSRGGKTESFDFWDSSANSANRGAIRKLAFAPNKYDGKWRKAVKAFHDVGAYDVLSCLTKSDPGSFSDFCSEYGYSEDSRKALETYLAVQAEFIKVFRLWPHCLDRLQAIN
jgi:hypothetical protein